MTSPAGICTPRGLLAVSPHLKPAHMNEQTLKDTETLKSIPVSACLRPLPRSEPPSLRMRRFSVGFTQLPVLIALPACV